MAILVTKPERYAKCVCCGSDKYYMHEFQFFQDPGSKLCITLCNACVNQMHMIVIKDICDRIEEKNKKGKIL